MSYTIKNLHEISGRPLLRERHVACSAVSVGLGPDDLVVIDKQEKAFLQMPITVFSYHQICGFNYDDPNHFSAYFEDLISRQERGSYLPFTKSYSLIKGRLFTFNSFSKSDMFLTALPGNPKSTISLFYSDTSAKNNETNINNSTNDSKNVNNNSNNNNIRNSNGNKNVFRNNNNNGNTDKPKVYNDKSEIPEELWKQVRICSALRFFRASQPMLYSIFGSRIEQSYALRVFRVDPLSYDDFCFAVENHALSDEFVASLAAGLIISLETQEITAFVFNFQNKIPTIFYHLSRYISPLNTFSPVFIPLVETHLESFCDDLDSVFTLLQYLLKNNSNAPYNSYSKYISILSNSLWSTPMCALYLAKLALCEDDITRALVYLNAACFVKNWPTAIFDVRAPTVTKANHELPFNNPQCEARVINSPLVGVNSEYFRTVFKIIQYPDFKQTWEEKFTGITKFGQNSKHYSNWPKGNYIINENRAEELFLFDPGIECPIEYEVLKNFPLAPFLYDVINDAKTMLEKRNEFLSKDFNDKSDLFSILLLALRINDTELIKKCYDWAKKIGANGNEKILLFCAKIKGFGLATDDINEIKVLNMTQTDTNALVFLQDLAFAFERLDKSPNSKSLHTF